MLIKQRCHEFIKFLKGSETKVMQLCIQAAELFETSKDIQVKLVLGMTQNLLR